MKEQLRVSGNVCGLSLAFWLFGNDLGIHENEIHVIDILVV